MDATLLFKLLNIITPWALAGLTFMLSFSSSPTFIVLPGGGFVMLIDVTELPPTITLILANIPLSAVAVIIAEPSLNALTQPVGVTVTVFGSLDTQVSFALELLAVTGTTPSMAYVPFFR